MRYWIINASKLSLKENPPPAQRSAQSEMWLELVLEHMDTICEEQGESEGPSVLFYLSIHLFSHQFASYSILRAPMSINQSYEHVRLFPAIIKRWFKIRSVKTHRSKIQLAPLVLNTRVLSHLCNLWPPWEMRMVRAQATNRQKNSRDLTFFSWNSGLNGIKKGKKNQLGLFLF